MRFRNTRALDDNLVVRRVFVVSGVGLVAKAAPMGLTAFGRKGRLRGLQFEYERSLVWSLRRQALWRSL